MSPWTFLCAATCSDAHVLNYRVIQKFNGQHATSQAILPLHPMKSWHRFHSLVASVCQALEEEVFNIMDMLCFLAARAPRMISPAHSTKACRLKCPKRSEAMCGMEFIQRRSMCLQWDMGWWCMIWIDLVKCYFSELESPRMKRCSCGAWNYLELACLG